LAQLAHNWLTKTKKGTKQIMKKILYILAIAILPLCSFAAETQYATSLKEKIQKILNDKTIEDTYERWNTAYRTTWNDIFLLSPEEAMPLLNGTVLPFIEKKIKDNKKQNRAKAYFYDQLMQLYEKRGEQEDYVVAEVFAKKAVEYAERSANDLTYADMCHSYGRILSTAGSIPLAHEYIYKAIKLYESANRYDGIFSCLYLITENLLQVRDIAGLSKVIEQMQTYIEQNPSPFNYYNLYTVSAAYYCVLSEDYPENNTYKEKELLMYRKAIDLIEKEPEKYLAKGFDYFNMSVSYRKSYPAQYDSIYYFLNKALESKVNSAGFDTELEICVYTAFAELHFEQKRYKEAEKDIFYVLSLLEEVKDNNSVIVDFSEAYKFLVLFYETLNRPADALKYQKLLTENEKRRYENDKIVAMDDMLVKYEVEKKNEQLDRMAERAKATRNILILTFSLTTALFIVLLILIRLHRLRKKNLEQTIYESVLFAELKQNELESIKQRLEQNPIKAVIAKLTEWITHSAIEKTKKTAYIQQLSELDLEMLEKGYLAAHEKLTNLDMKYIICFAMDMDVKDMSLLFNIESNSIYIIRYRIKRKLGNDNSFNFLM